MFGRQIDYPIDLRLGRPDQESGDQDKTEYVQRLQARLDRGSCVSPWEHEVREREAQAVLRSQGTESWL